VRKIKTVQCIQCGKDHDFDDSDMDCTSCGGNLHVIYDYKLIRKRLTYETLEADLDKSIWRYILLLLV
jgi:ribosomal protein L37E